MYVCMYLYIYIGEATLGAGGGPAPLAENVILCNFGFGPPY
jgi:hypothetical protein